MKTTQKKTQYTLAELIDGLDVSIKGDPDCVIHGVGTIQDAQAGHIAFLMNPLYKKYLETTGADAVILTQKESEDCPPQINAVISPDPYYTYAKIAAYFDQKPIAPVGIHPSAVIGEDCKIGKGVSIGPNAVIANRVKLGANVVIGAGCVIGEQTQIDDDSQLDANVTLYHQIIIGKRVHIASGAVIGGDGFGLAKHKGQWQKIPQIGSVRIEDDVEVGANTTIDRGAIEDTLIEKGVKLDNLVQVGHNVRIGENTAIAGCVGIAGSTSIGKNCLVGGAAGFAGHINIADDVVITGGTEVTKSIRESGIYSSGVGGLVTNMERRKTTARVQRLEQLLNRVKALEFAFEELTEKRNMKCVMDIHEILKYLPHRNPFLLIDRVIEMVEGESLVAIKNVTMNEEYFRGHFPMRPVMPGVLILEALAQAAGVLAYKSTNTLPSDGVLYFLAGIDNARFRRVVEPGDQLRLEVKVLRYKRDMWKLAGQALVDGELACSAELLSARRG